MAESLLSKLVGAVISQAVRTVAELLKNEAVSLTSVRGEVEGLQAELRRMKCFLEDADRKQQQDNRVRNWIVEVGDVAHDVEDVIETFIWKVSSSYAVFKVCHLHKLRNEINFIRGKMNDIFKSTQSYNIGFSSGEGTSSMADQLLRNLRRSYPDDEDEDIIILEDSTAALKGELMKVEDRLCVASVVGMGGLGKTTLAKTVYNHVKHHFDRYAWVFVSQQYVPREILSEILMQIGFDHTQNYERRSIEEKTNKREILRKLEDHDLVELLKNELREKRYLVVLDDIWRIEAWDSIKNAFPKGKRGSKVFFTTRNKEVALFADPRSSPIEPPFLTSEESWELLRQKAFLRSTSNEYDIRPEFEVLGREMLRKCEGLPLAIIILGGLLRTRDSIDGWKEVKKDLTAHLNKLRSHQQYEGVGGILSLSYYDLPYYLKPCFLYLGIFPEDSEIPKRTLFQLWIAEGFVQAPSHGGETEEDVAERYMGELTSRCLVQVSKRNESGIGVKAYRMHDLMRDMCLSKAKDENFFQNVQEPEMNTTIQSRRIAIHHPRCDFSRYQVQTRLRSLVCFKIKDFPTSCLRSKSFITLRELELGFSRLGIKFSMLKEICQLIHLRHLGLRRTGIRTLPNTISNLQNLYTLDLRNNDVILPWGMSRLTRLTHLFASLAYNFENWRPPRYKGYRNSRVLLLRKDKCSVRFDILVKLTNLQNLKIKIARAEDVRALLEFPIFKSDRLRSLVLSLMDNAEFPNLESLSHHCLLSKLHLSGTIPEGNLQYLPPSLVKLTLICSSINQDPMPVLEKLPNLRFLWLAYNSYRGSEMVCSADEFPKLEILRLVDLRSLNEWQIEKGAMPSLKRLLIAELDYLKMIPEGLKFVTTLRELDVSSMPSTFAERLRADQNNGIEGEDYYKVKLSTYLLFYVITCVYLMVPNFLSQCKTESKGAAEISSPLCLCLFS
ncbi:hypothetical protein TIFTF001_038987 [Ficus carica]|uniref:Uncharacterized protein n=1 Tax=Ficus carica TaxID=3494 RepID=A0AA88EBI8_FICCA|nr:hypothetical protein TIFTF001_038987 [Ficus carica]